LTKNISDYFDNWTHIDANNQIGGWMPTVTPILDQWCEDRISIRGRFWDRYHKPEIPSYKTTTIHRGAILHLIYRFKFDQDAMLFVLTHSGKYPMDQ
jgi:hypothetical protein